jgi:hypothetical protein
MDFFMVCDVWFWICEIFVEMMKLLLLQHFGGNFVKMEEQKCEFEIENLKNTITKT